MNTHTQEPWKVSTSRSLEIVDASGVALLEMWRRGNPDKEQADARRIVACVNACAGLGTEFLESIPDVCFKANTTDCASIMIENATLKQRRDELLAEAVRVSAILVDCPQKKRFVDAIAKAQSSEPVSYTKPQPRLTVVLQSYPESNGKRNWTATLRPVEKWDGLVGSLGGITIGRGECWNRIAYEAERARFMLGERDTEPYILDYGDDIETPDQWAGELHGGRKTKAQVVQL